MDKQDKILKILQNAKEQADALTATQAKELVNLLVKLTTKQKEELVSKNEDFLATVSQETFTQLQNALIEIREKANDNQLEVRQLTNKQKIAHESKMAQLEGLINELKSIEIRDGIDGKDGVNGTDGKDGSPDTPEEVRDKLETLKEDDRLDSTAIKGLDKLPFVTEQRAMGILDQRTSFLIQKVSNLQTQVNNSSGGASTLAQVSAGSLTTPNSLYTMTSTIPVEFRSSDGNPILYIDETTERVMIGGNTYAYDAPLKVTSTVSGPAGFNTGLVLRGAAPGIVFEDTSSSDGFLGVENGDFFFYTGASATTSLLSLRPSSATMNLGTLSILWNTDNTYDIGASGANRPKSLYLGTSMVWGSSNNLLRNGDIAVTPNFVIRSASSVGNLYIGGYSSGGGSQNMQWGYDVATGVYFPVGDNVNDIGKAANRVKTGYFGTSVDVAGGSSMTSANVYAGSTSVSGAFSAYNAGVVKFYAGAGAVAVVSNGYYAIGSSTTNVFSQDVYLNRQSVGVFGIGTTATGVEGGLTLANIRFGGATSSFPMFKRYSTTSQVVARTADDTSDAGIRATEFVVTGGASGSIYFNDGSGNYSRIYGASFGDGVIKLANNGNTDFNRLCFGGTTSSFPALKRSSADLQFKLADDSAYTYADALGYKISGAASSGKILKANGTGFVASTETYAAPGTSGNVMTSDGTNWTSAAPSGGGNPGWDFVSYNTSTSGLTLTVSSLGLSTDLSYKILYQFEGDNNNTPIYMRINGITTSSYISAGWRTYMGASVATESRSASTTSWWVDGGNSYKNGSGEIKMDLVKIGTGGSYGCQVQGKHTGRGNGSSDNYFQNYDWSGIQTSQTDVTSITLFTDSTTNANIRVWVFKSAQS